MPTSPGGAEETKSKILAAARRLFSEHELESVSVRDIATEAGITHPLVHRYFGTKDEIIAEIIRREIATEMMWIPSGDANSEDSLEALKQLIHWSMNDGRTKLNIIVRAELAGMKPEQFLGKGPLTPAIADWILERRSSQGVESDHLPDPRLSAIIAAAALYSFATITPWLVSVVGMDMDEFESKQDELVTLLANSLAYAGGDGEGGARER